MRCPDHTPAAGFDRRGKPNTPRPLTWAERQRIERLVEHLLELLDEADGDPDLEPSFGAYNDGAPDEAEPDGDDEPSLGSPNPEPDVFGYEGAIIGLVRYDGFDQRNWSSGRDDDREGEHDGREPRLVPARLDVRPGPTAELGR